MSRVLAVDDDDQILENVRRALERYGFDVRCVADADEALRCVESFDPDIVVLDIMMPGMSGTDLCRELRRTRDVPIIFLSGLNADMDRIVGLELGADDYITKPFHPGELLARVKAVLRRSGANNTVAAKGATDDVLSHGRLRLELQQFSAFVDDALVELTKTEFLLLKTLMRRPTKVYSRDELMHGAHGPGTYVDGRTINSHIRRLRSKLADAGIDPIETVRGVGYRIASQD